MLQLEFKPAGLSDNTACAACISERANILPIQLSLKVFCWSRSDLAGKIPLEQLVFYELCAKDRGCDCGPQEHNPMRRLRNHALTETRTGPKAIQSLRVIAVPKHRYRS